MITSLTMREEVIQGANEIGSVKANHMKIKTIDGGGCDEEKKSILCILHRSRLDISVIILTPVFFFTDDAEACCHREPKRFTGSSSDSNPWMLRAAELDIRVRRKGCRKGDQAGHEDSASDPTVAVDKTKKLLEVDKADAIIGPLPAAAAAPVAALLKPLGIPHIGIMELMPQILATGDHVFAHTGTQRGTGFFVGTYAYDVLGYKTATVIHDDIIFAEEFTQGAMDGFVSRGGKIIQRQRAPMNTVDYGPYLTAMKQADCCMFWFVPFHTLQFINQYSQYGFKMPLVQGGCTTLIVQNLKALGDKALNLISSSAYDAYVKGPDVKGWVDRWVKLHGSKARQGRSISL
jgi:ABC-type branched-subunit amino acid transport system substrate-binding protein